jgi:hypothetical protein
MSWFSRLIGHGQEPEGKPPCPIRFDRTGWHPQRRSEAPSTSWQWKDDDGQTLTVRAEQTPAFADGEATDLARLRAVCRETASLANSAIVQVDPIEVAAIPGLLLITKARAGLGSLFVGRLVFPLAGPHYVVEVVSSEGGVTGQREAIATAALAQRGELRFEPPESPGGPSRIKEWCQDPYDPAFDPGALNCLSDDERLDAVLPRHPLSKIRATLTLIRNTATLEAPMPLGTVPGWPPASADTREPRRGRMSSGTVGLLCFQAGLFHQSEQAFMDSIAESETDGRAPDVDVAHQLLLLGLSCDCQGKHLDAVSFFQRSERAAVAVGPDHPLVAQAVNNQARAHLAIKDHAAAEPLFERALALFESKDGEGTNVAIALNGLGAVRNAQERYDEAIPPLERALEIFEREHGPQFQDCGTVWGHLAIAFAHTGDERRAKNALSRAQSILGSLR